MMERDRRDVAMTQKAFERGDWQAVIEEHQLESHDPQEWLRYGVALLQTIQPGPDVGKQQQQAALAFVQAQKEGTSAEAVKASQRQSALLSLEQAMQLAGLKSGPQIAQQLEFVALQVQIQLLLTGNNWSQAAAELERLPEHCAAYQGLRDQIRASVLSAFCGSGGERTPTDYAGVNQIREDTGASLIEQWREGLEVTASLEKATPLVLINGFASARRQLKGRPFWIAYGNVRSGSTMVFNLLRILANSLSNSAISAWEGDLASPEKFFDLVDESPGVNLGVLKIHRCHEAINARLAAGEARAILSHREMKAACFSYWRMLSNPRSPFFNRDATLAWLDGFLEAEIRSFQQKSLQKNTLIVREVDLRSATSDAIARIADFVGVSLADESRQYLADFLDAKQLRRLAEVNQKATNSTGHERVTYLHPGHIAVSSSEQQCPPEVREHVERLIEQNQVSLDQDGYCRLVDASA